MKSFLTLNPSYSIRQDGNRVLIHGKDDERFKSKEWFSFIHPYYGMLFSFFSHGLTTLEEKLKSAADFFGHDTAYILDIITPFVDNSNTVSITTKNKDVNYFPPNLLISSDIPILRKREYAVSDFTYKGIPDYDSNRLEYPLSINLELLMKCYTDCCYCYADRRRRSESLLPTERVIELIREARRNNVVVFDINGGEVLMHPDIKIILKELKDNGFDPLVSTKIPVGKQMMEFFKDINLERFQISLDSVDEDILIKTLSAPQGYLSQIKNTLEYASIIGLRVDINTVLTKYNVDYLKIEKLLEFTSSFPCVKRHRLNPVGYSLYKNNFELIAPEKKDLDIVESMIPAWIEKYGLDINLSYFECKSQFEKHQKAQSFPSRAICTGNVWNMVILPNGDVTICEELYYNDIFKIGNLQQSSIKEVWNSQRAIDLYNLSLSTDSKSVCKGCNDFHECRLGRGVCWKTILMAYGNQNWDFPDPRCPKAPFPYNKFYY